MDNSKYYESFDWSNFKDANINLINLSSLIPKDVHTIADIGCGNGLITNKLGEKYKVIGIDRSVEALKNVTTDKLEASCDSIPLPDNSFDLVLSSELLEHLEMDTFEKTIKEIKRLSKNYILISVPNNESLSKGLIQCPKCETTYHRCYHQQKFNEKYLSSLFDGFEMVKSKTFGINVRVYNYYIATLKHRFTPAKSWIPYYWTKKGERSTMCPKCEHHFEYPFSFNPIAFAFDCINFIFTKKIPFHLVVLLKRK